MDFLIIILILMFLYGANIKITSKQEKGAKMGTKIVNTDKIAVWVENPDNISNACMLDILELSIKIQGGISKTLNDNRYYTRDACGHTYYLVNGVIYGVATNVEGGFDRLAGCPVTQFDELNKDEFHDLIMELTQYFNTVNL